MSVINDMLRDLDKRQAPELGGMQSSHQESLIGPPSFLYPKIIIIVSLILLTALLAYFLFDGKESASEVQIGIVRELKPDVGFIQSKREDVVKQNSASDLPVEHTAFMDNSGGEKQKNDTSKVVRQNAVNNSNVSNSETLKKNALKNQVLRTHELKNETLKKQTPEIAFAKVEQDIPIKNFLVNEASTSNTDLAEEYTAIGQKITAHDRLKTKALPTSQELNNIGVTLSPIALDQKMAERALSLISQRKEIEAYRELYAFIGEHDEDMESRTVLATYLLNENRMAEVGDILLNAPLNKSPKLRQIKARWYVQQGKHNLALYILSSDLPEVSAHTDYYVLLAAYYQRYGAAKDAKQSYSILLDYDESVADWWAGLGLASDRNNEKEQAVYAYKQALELNGLSSDLSNFVKPRLKQLLATTPRQ